MSERGPQEYEKAATANPTEASNSFLRTVRKEIKALGDYHAAGGQGALQGEVISGGLAAVLFGLTQPMAHSTEISTYVALGVALLVPVAGGVMGRNIELYRNSRKAQKKAE